VISLRVRVALVCTVAVVVLLGVGSLVIGRSVSRSLEHEFDRLTLLRLTGAATGIEFEHGGIEVHGQGSDVLTLSIVTAAGLQIMGEPWLQPPHGLTVGGKPALGYATSSAGEPCRTAWMRMRPEDDGGPAKRSLDIGIAMSLAELHRQQLTIHETLTAGAFMIAIAVSLVLALTLGRMLAPHTRLAAQVGELDPRRPGRRLDTAHLPPELCRIAERINDLCDRLERAHGLASSFHAAAAHELRTPLAGLRATIEVATQPGADTTSTLATCHAIALQMQARVDNLLMAARIDAGQLVPHRDEIDVHDMLRQAWQQVEERARARDIAVGWNLSGSGLAIADPEALRMVLANLCDNVVSHATGKHEVTITCADAGGRLVLSIANPAATMTQETAQRIFDRGWRTGSGSSDRRHVGLGMAIARELVGLMSGRIEARVSDGNFTIDITLPAPGVFEYW
jgi:two-component system, OmpR family, heavy metal sensor histidine kinase CusS